MITPLPLPIGADPLPCRANPRLWFEPPHYPAAIAACSRCPVLADCRSLGAGERWGVWGGIVRDPARPPESRPDRRRFPAKPLPVACPRCGVDPGTLCVGDAGAPAARNHAARQRAVAA